jgi:hypothetical protein
MGKILQAPQNSLSRKLLSTQATNHFLLSRIVI